MKPFSARIIASLLVALGLVSGCGDSEPRTTFRACNLTLPTHSTIQVDTSPEGEVVAEGAFVNGVKAGLWNYWYEGGEPKARGVYANGREQGSWIGWYPNGICEAMGRFQDGERSGAWLFFEEDGSVREGSSGMYEDGARKRELTQEERRRLLERLERGRGTSGLRTAR